MENVQIIVHRSNQPDELMHYRTKGSINGQRRYQYLDGSLTPEGRIHYGVGAPRGEGKSEESTQRRSLGQVMKDRKVAKKRAENLAKARAVKAAKKKAAEEEAKKKAEQEAAEAKEREAYEKAKARIIESGTASEVLAIKDHLTPAERSTIETRMRWEDNMRVYQDKEIKAAKEEADKFFKKMEDVTDKAQKVAKAYNMGANVVNAFAGDKLLPRVDTEITKGNEWKRKKQNNNNNNQNNNNNNNNNNQQNKGDDQNKGKTESNSNTQQQSKQSKKEQKAQAKAEKKAAKEQTKSSKSEEKKVYTGTVEGEGTSKKKNTSEKKSKSSDYYDPIDAEWRWADDTNYYTPATYNSGRNIVSGYLEDRYKR